MLCVVMCVSCHDTRQWKLIDHLNTRAYKSHYANLDSVSHYAREALGLSKNYDCGRAEALNNLAFVSIMRMDYAQADTLLHEIAEITDNQLELLVADIQLMRVCQRKSQNRDFYIYQERAKKYIARLEAEKESLSPRERQRLAYAKSEYAIVFSAYLYYMGQMKQSHDALALIDEGGEIQKDTAQLLNYFYNVGSGGFFSASTPLQLAQLETDYLVRCVILAKKAGLHYWEANALQALSEHLQDSTISRQLIADNMPTMRYLNPENVPDSLLAGNMAQRSVNTFAEFGDVYQTAGALRTLSQCYFDIGDYYSAIDCLNEALTRDTLINQAAALVVSIHEQLSIDYSAVDDKANSDASRNVYLDRQDETRQDRYLEARAAQLDTAARQLNIILSTVIIAIAVVVILLILFTRMRRHSEESISMEKLLEPLRTWQENTARAQENYDEAMEELGEQRDMLSMQAERSLQQNIEQRARMSLINSVTPFIDRMLVEVKCLCERQESEEVRRERYEYIAELAKQINRYNQVLTDWIQLRRGELSLKAESFPMQQLFDILKKGRQSFQLKGVELVVEDTTEWVKADRVLTLFMVNTLADNARKFTPEGGRVRVFAEAGEDYVEIAVADTGQGMNEEQLASVFSHQPNKKTQHGFGLMNCKGIIEKYRKISSVFSVCQITAESHEGRGSTFRFRLPKGVMRMLVGAVAMLSVCANAGAMDMKAKAVADSIFFFNLQGRYEDALTYADSVKVMLDGKLQDNDNVLIYLDMNNEAAIAALALHRWDLYQKYNKEYIEVFREKSADHSIGQYVSRMQSASSTKNIAIVILVVLLLSIFPAYYLLYYRHRVYYRYLVNCVDRINIILLSDATDEKKLSHIRQLWKERMQYTQVSQKAQKLDTLVAQVCEALQHNIDSKALRETDIEMARDEVSRINYELERLHVNNNVLDNCFSTLKHETMYFPSRILQMVEAPGEDLDALRELTDYYKELYTILSAQAQHQIRSLIHLDGRLGQFLHRLLTRLGGGRAPEYRISESADSYITVSIPMPEMHLTDSQVTDLFTPATVELPCLVIRQIVREIGETTNLRRSGIQAVKAADESTIIEIIIPKNIWKSLKLS